MTHSKYKPFMTYLEPKDMLALKKLSKKHNQPMAVIVREALMSKLTQGDPYTAGFNDGIDKSIEAVHLNNGAQLRFPSGASLAELLENDLIKLKMKEIHEAPNR
jgi:hypothetical protein